jgi:hypothetical protein
MGFGRLLEDFAQLASDTTGQDIDVHGRAQRPRVDMEAGARATGTGAAVPPARRALMACGGTEAREG